MTTPVAVKKLKSGAADPNDFLTEAQIMKKLRHPRLLQLYAVCTKDEPILIITELMHQNLLHFLQVSSSFPLFATFLSGSWIYCIVKKRL